MVAHTCNPSCSEGWGRRIAWIWEAEVAVSQYHATALQPGWQSETLSQNKTKQCLRWWLTPVIPALWEVKAGGSFESGDRDQPGQHGETLSLQKISWVWWRAPVIPATQEAEARELPEPRRRRLQWAEIAPLHSSLGNKSETPSQKKKERKKKKKKSK